MMDASPLLQIRNLKVVLGGATIIDLPELDIHRGEVLVVLGPNGAGKSTLLLTAARLLKPVSGSITLVDSPHLSDLEYRRRVATVFQAPLLLDETVYQNAAAGLRFRGVPEKLAYVESKSLAGPAPHPPSGKTPGADPVWWRSAASQPRPCFLSRDRSYPVGRAVQRVRCPHSPGIIG